MLAMMPREKKPKKLRWCKLTLEGDEWLATYLPEYGNIPCQVLLGEMTVHQAKIEAREFCHLSASEIEVVEVRLEQRKIVKWKKWLEENPEDLEG